MALDFDWSAAAPTAKAARNKTGKVRGSNPPGARTRNEPPRVIPKPAYRDAIDGFNYRPATRVALPDTIELRKKVAAAALGIERARDVMATAVKDFEALGALPDAIIADLSQSVRRHLRLFKTTKPQKIKPPYRVLRRVESETVKGRSYEIREDNFGHIWCTCPSRKQPCKHLRADEKE